MPKKHKCPEFVNHERWLVSYADFITLLFAFFTVLYAIGSTTDSEKVEKFVGSADRAFGGGIFSVGSDRLFHLGNMDSIKDGMIDLGIDMKKVQEDIEEKVKKETKTGQVKVEQTLKGLRVTINTIGFFKSGSDELQLAAFPILKKVAESLKTSLNKIRIEGHTDDVPIRQGRFSSNWDLSAARAISVLKVFLLEGVAPHRMIVTGRAQYRPIDTNRSAKGRAKNRRVEIYLLPPDKPKSDASTTQVFREDADLSSLIENLEAEAEAADAEKSRKLKVVQDEFEQF